MLLDILYSIFALACLSLILTVSLGLLVIVFDFIIEIVEFIKDIFF